MHLKSAAAITALVLCSSACVPDSRVPSVPSVPSFVVAVGEVDAGASSPARFACSGTLIAPTVVVTAAHCVDDGDEVRVLRFRNGDRCTDPLESIQVKHVRRTSDLMILELQRPLTGSVSTVRVERDNADDTLVAWGWGGINGAVCRVRPVMLMPVDAARCRPLDVADSPFLCAKGRTDNTCVGDSGGPVVSDGMPIAITIRGLGCLPSDAGLYALLG